MKKKIIISAVVLIILITLILFRCDIYNFIFPDIHILSQESVNSKISIDDILSIREFQLKLFTGIIAILGVFLALWRTSILEKNFRNDTRRLEHQQNNLEFERSKFSIQQRNDRYNKAVELLGNENIAVRIGAIYTLKNLVEEDNSFYRAFIDILKGYVKSELLSERLLEEKKAWENKLEGWKFRNSLSLEERYDSFKIRPYRKLPEDIKTALYFLSVKEGKELIDFKNTDWEGFNFGDIGIQEFKYFNFENSILDYVYLSENQIINQCRLNSVSLKSVHFKNPEIKELYKDENGNYANFSTVMWRSLIDSIYLAVPLTDSVIEKTIFNYGLLMNDKASSNILFDDTIFDRTVINISFRNVLFRKCNFINTSIDKVGVVFDFVVFIDCIFHNIILDECFWKKVDVKRFPKTLAKETSNKNIVIMCTNTYSSIPDIQSKFAFQEIELNSNILKSISDNANKLSSVINSLSQKNIELGILLAKE